MSRSHKSIVALLVAIAGPSVWFAHFGLSYAAQSLLCASTYQQAGGAFLPLFVLGTLVACAALVAITAMGLRQGGSLLRTSDQTHFLADLTVSLAVLSAFGVTASLISTFLLPPCSRFLG
jgi:hypothetical protein